MRGSGQKLFLRNGAHATMALAESGSEKEGDTGGWQNHYHRTTTGLGAEMLAVELLPSPRRMGGSAYPNALANAAFTLHTVDER